MTKTRGIVLVVEDEDAICTYMEEIFKGEGYEVLSAPNGKAGIELLRTLKTLPSIIFLDMMMPVMDGRRFIDELQKNPENWRFKEIPLVVVTAVQSPVMGNLVEVVRKPPDIDHLIALAAKHAKPF